MFRRRGRNSRRPRISQPLPITITMTAVLFVAATTALAAGPPVVTSFSPSSGAVGRIVTLTGTDFTDANSVAFNATESTFTLDSDTQITTTVPDGATSGPITVITPLGSGQSASFTVLPSITSFDPASGPPGTLVTISGAAFVNVKRVTIGGARAVYAVVDYHTLTATVPTASVTGKIVIVTQAGTVKSPTNFTVISEPPPPPPPTSYACARVLGFSQTGQWYIQGNFESYVPGDNWESQTKGGGNINQWADPTSDFWNARVLMPCSFSPLERVMLNIGYKAGAANLIPNIYAAIQNIRDRWPTVRQIALQAIIGGPDDSYICTFDGKEVQAAKQHKPVLDAIAYVLANPSWDGLVGGLDARVQSCADFSDAEGHMRAVGYNYVAQTLGTYYANLP